MKPHVPRACAGEDAIEHEGVHVHVEIEGSAESLQYGDAAAPPVAHAVLTRPGALVSLDGAVKNTRDRPAEIVAPRE